MMIPNLPQTNFIVLTALLTAVGCGQIDAYDDSSCEEGLCDFVNPHHVEVDEEPLMDALIVEEIAPNTTRCPFGMSNIHLRAEGIRKEIYGKAYTNNRDTLLSLSFGVNQGIGGDSVSDVVKLESCKAQGVSEIYFDVMSFDGSSAERYVLDVADHNVVGTKAKYLGATTQRFQLENLLIADGVHPSSEDSILLGYFESRHEASNLATSLLARLFVRNKGKQWVDKKMVQFPARDDSSIAKFSEFFTILPDFKGKVPNEESRIKDTTADLELRLYFDSVFSDEVVFTPVGAGVQFELSGGHLKSGSVQPITSPLID